MVHVSVRVDLKEALFGDFWTEEKYYILPAHACGKDT